VGVLAWSLLPLVVLLALMASGHHLLYLLPLLVVAALLGLRALMPAAGGVPMTLALALYLGAWSFVAVPSLRIVLGPRLAEDRGLLALGQRVEQAGDAPLLVTLYGPDEVNPVHRGLWACPLGTRVLSVHDRQPERLTWLEGASDVLLVGAAPSEGVRVGPYHLEPVGEGAHIALDRRRSLWVVEAAVQ
jgi:hypothetical protein